MKFGEEHFSIMKRNNLKFKRVKLEDEGKILRKIDFLKYENYIFIKSYLFEYS